MEPITPEREWDVSGFSIDQARTRILYTMNEGGYTKLFGLDAGTFKPLMLRISEYGDPEKDRESLIRLSPITYIGGLTAPLLIIGGATDPRVPVGEALQMYEAAKKTGVQAELIVFADEGHGASRRENQVLMIGHALQWLKQYLK